LAASDTGTVTTWAARHRQVRGRLIPVPSRRLDKSTIGSPPFPVPAATPLLCSGFPLVLTLERCPPRSRPLLAGTQSAQAGLASAGYGAYLCGRESRQTPRPRRKGRGGGALARR